MVPKILISGCNESRILYENAVIQCGGSVESYYLPPLDGSCDGLLLCGGNDVDPQFYRQENIACQKLDTQRDRIEIELAKMYLDAGKPVLGICRGMQLLNVALGGTLQQDIGEEMHVFHSHWQEPMDKTHPIRTKERSLIYSLYGERPVVNTLHHQALDRLGEGLLPTAWAESGIIEAVEHVSLPVFALQWHPERMSFERRRSDTVDGSLVFKWFIEAVKAKEK